MEIRTKRRQPIPRAFIAVSCLVTANLCFGDLIELEWNPNVETVGGYRLYYGYSSRDYIGNIDVGDVTAYSFDAQEACKEYFFAVTAYDVTRTLESGFSNEVEAQTLCPGPRMGIGEPSGGSRVKWPFRISGWAVDLSAPTGTGVDVVHIWAFPGDGSPPTFLTGAIPNVSRPDVAAYFGDSRFEPSGFSVVVSTPLPDGDYTLGIYARSTVTSTFFNLDVSVTLEGGTLIFLNDLTDGASVSVPFDVSGWTVYTPATSGTGIDLVHIWAFPVGGGPGIFLGAPTLGLSRPDVATYFNEPRYIDSGFHLEVTTPLVPGNYFLNIYARNTVTASFDFEDFKRIRVSVSAGSDPRMAVDDPNDGETIMAPFAIAGWAVDLGASRGVGVDVIHAWAFPDGGGAPFFIGGATPTVERPDIAASFGNQFLNAGFEMDVAVSITPGNYTIRVYARSTVTGSFNQVRSVSLVVQ